MVDAVRELVEPAIVLDRPLPAGTLVMVSPVLVHHNSDPYPQADLFQPERFLEQRPRNAADWIPFGGGRRHCLGAELVMFEMQIILKRLLSRFVVAPAGRRVEGARLQGTMVVPSREEQAPSHPSAAAGPPLNLISRVDLRGGWLIVRAASPRTGMVGLVHRVSHPAAGSSSSGEEVRRMYSEKITFLGSGGAPLAARLDFPDSQPRAYALFAHCFTCSKDGLAATRLAQALTGFGIAVLRFDLTGLGGSGGDFANTNFTSNIADLVNAADHLRNTYTAPTILIGHSLGGAAVLAAAEQLPGVRAVATIGAPADTEHVLQLLAERRDEIEEDGEAQICLAGRPFRIRRQFLEDIAHQPQLDRIRRLDAALLVMHSPADEIVGIDNARTIFDAARHPKSFVSLDGADHLLTRAADARFAAAMLASWATRYLDEDPVPRPGSANSSTAQTEPGLVVVSENGAGPYGQRITAGRHRLTADEPAPIGHDGGLSPYDLLLAGLGACTSMTLRMYAARQQWPLDRVTVSLRHSRIHATDCADCATQTGQLDRVERTIRLTGGLDDDQRRRLLEIADRCPVHRTLGSAVDVRTTLASDELLPVVAADPMAKAPA